MKKISRVRAVRPTHAEGKEVGRLYETSLDGKSWLPVTRGEFDRHKGVGPRRILLSIDPDAA
ncbi:hypothetical protein BN2476_830026 [Paraburkholderia piptadeniae]|uniref:Uncharacterized protein n=1 Tax=Paraburkholderia piptadeniae TaxID=1701573 RepID=A0A1N7SSK7_9BURK|nr:hypothetical protein [Paraburkholderia piptadeniae]SIT50455.1 hypothetical protein BN2476_830026 [Paraburkholderia piptadeniae]